MKVFLNSVKGKVVISAGAVLIIVAVIMTVVLTHRDTYRSIAIEQLTGSVTVIGEKNSGPAYVGQHFYSGDDVTVEKESDLTMCMDEDKYVHADAETHFVLQASAANEDSRISIYLDEGSTLHELKSKLEANETYEVDTPSSTMAVRGTTFRVSVLKGTDDMVYTLTEVTDGEVAIRLKSTDGTYNGIEKSFTPGQSALVRANDKISEFVTADMISPDGLLNEGLDAPEVLILSYDDMSDNGVARIEALVAGVDKKAVEDAEAAKAEEDAGNEAEAENEAVNDNEAEAEEVQTQESDAEEAVTSEAAEQVEEAAEPEPAGASTDVDAITAYATSLGYNVYRYSSGGTNVFQCVYDSSAKGKVYKSSAEVQADSPGFMDRYVIVYFTTSDFMTVTDEAASYTNYTDPANMFTTIVAKRPFTSLDATYQMLSAAKPYFQ